MSGASRVDQTPVRLNTVVKEERQTPKTDFGSRLKDGVDATVGIAGSIASSLPGGAILSAAVSAGSSLGSGAGKITGAPILNAPGTTVVGVGDSGTPVTVGGSQAYNEGMNLLTAQQTSNMQYLTLQNAMQQENQQYTSLSNVMKVRSDTTKNTLQNIH